MGKIIGRVSGIITMVLVIASLVLVGCTQPAPTPPKSPAPPATTPAPVPTPATKPTPSPAPAATAVQPKYGGVLRFSLASMPAGFDTHRKPSYSPYIGMLVFNNLVKFDTKYADMDPKHIVGDLAERWEVSPDGKVYTFYLRKGVKWHDGKPFTADDVVYSYEKMLDPKRSSIVEFQSGLSKIERVDDTTVKFTFSSPSASWLILQTSGYTPIQPKHKADADFRKPDFLVGTGPFKFKELVSGVSVELAKNPDYFKKDANGRALPYLDGVKIFIISDRSAMNDKLATKQLDMLQPGHAVFSEEQYQEIKTKIPEAVTEFQIKAAVTALWFNFAHKPLDDMRVRQAMSLVLNQRDVVIASYGAAQWGTTGHGIFPPIWGLPENEIAKMMEWDKPLDTRVQEAKKLMTDAGFPNGIKVDFPTEDTDATQRRVFFIADQLRKYLNCQVTTTVYPRDKMTAMRDAGQFDLHSKDIPAFMGDPTEYMAYFVTGASSNFFKYSDPQVDKLFNSQVSEMDPAKRAETTRQIERILLQQWVACPSFYTVSCQAWWPYVKGYKPFTESYQANVALEEVWLDK